MKHLVVLGTGVIGAVRSGALLGTGVAAAADYDGQTYADAAAAIEESGGTLIIATQVGGQRPQGECIVATVQDHSFVRDPLDGVHVHQVADEVRLNLNCAGGYATVSRPGASVASPAGREAKTAADEAAAAEEQQLAEVSTPDE
jgi:hypothetical protein